MFDVWAYSTHFSSTVTSVYRDVALEEAGMRFFTALERRMFARIQTRIFPGSVSLPHFVAAELYVALAEALEEREEDEANRAVSCSPKNCFWSR